MNSKHQNDKKNSNIYKFDKIQLTSSKHFKMLNEIKQRQNENTNLIKIW